MSDGLQFTGERFTPECLREIWYEHYHRYVFARSLVEGMDVLDAACGEGYGSALLSEVADSVVGVDIDEAAIAHARERYRAGNLKFEQGSCTALPFDENQFDRVVSFETLEHLQEHEQLMTEFRRVLKPGGLLLISSPDKAVYSEKLGNENEFHLRELYRAEFESLISASFPAAIFWGQKLMFQSVIWSAKSGSGLEVWQQGEESLTKKDRPLHDPVYWIALCAASEDLLPERPLALSLFDDAAESVYEHYYHEIRKNMQAGGLLQEKENKIKELQVQLDSFRQPTHWWKRLFGRDR